MKLILGDCLEKLKDLPENSVDSVVTDPPYELGFMGKSWDNTGIANNLELWKLVLRVLKPGGHLLSFGGSRTYHRMACAIEDAGFEIRDQIMWVYGSGFPKSLNIGKAVEEWEGWGTALKPAHEPIVLARKPLSEKTVATNVLKHGTGGINIDGSRVGTEIVPINKLEEWSGFGQKVRPDYKQTISTGRFPANFIHDGSEEVVGLFPETKSGKMTGEHDGFGRNGIYSPSGPAETYTWGDEGSAARFFYCAKSSRSERNKGLEGFEEVREADRTKDDGAGGDNPRNRSNNPKQNSHPTVKPLSLMRYLVKLITPPKGTCLDPFLGSGTTGIACKLEGFDFIGIEREADYIKIAEARIAGWKKEAEQRKLL